MLYKNWQFIICIEKYDWKKIKEEINKLILSFLLRK